MELPIAVQVLSHLAPGSVYYLKTSDIDYHYFVVANNNPMSAGSLILICGQSAVQKRVENALRLGLNKDSLVVVAPEECGFLKHQTVFDCNYPRIITKQELVKKATSNTLHVSKSDRVSTSVLDKIQLGIKSSKLVSKKDKLLLE